MKPRSTLPGDFRRGAVFIAMSAVLAALSTAGLAAADLPAPPPSTEALVALHGAQSETDPAKALAILLAYKGPDHAWVETLRGQLSRQLAQSDADPAARFRHLADAQSAFAAAVALDPSLRQAHLGLAQLAAERGDYRTAGAEIGVGLEWADASAAELKFAAQCALQCEDWRLATVIAQQGMERFPTDPDFRHLELVELVRGGRADEARQALTALLAQNPLDGTLWRQLAWADNETHHDDEAVAALEIALQLAPDDRDLRRNLAASQLSHGMPQAALATVRPLMDVGGDHAPTDAALSEFAARCADEAGQPHLGRAWLQAIPVDQRSRSARLLAARLAVHDDDAAAAVAALKELTSQGEHDASVLAWAGQVAEQAKDAAAAESFYLLAAGSDQPAAAAAGLRLVALYLKQDRMADARTQLATHLAKYPGDDQARALLAQLSRVTAKPGP